MRPPSPAAAEASSSGAGGVEFPRAPGRGENKAQKQAKLAAHNDAMRKRQEEAQKRLAAEVKAKPSTPEPAAARGSARKSGAGGKKKAGTSPAPSAQKAEKKKGGGWFGSKKK